MKKIFIGIIFLLLTLSSVIFADNISHNIEIINPDTLYSHKINVQSVGNIPPPNNILLNKAGHSYLEIYWEDKPMYNNGVKEYVSDYFVRKRKTNTTTWKIDTIGYKGYRCPDLTYITVVLPADTIQLFRNLEPCTEYEFQVSRVNPDGSTSAFSNSYKFKTEECNNPYFNSICLPAIKDNALAKLALIDINKKIILSQNDCQNCSNCINGDFGYSYLKSVTNTFRIGETNKLKLKVHPQNDITPKDGIVKLWIDLNQNKIFDNNELVTTKMLKVPSLDSSNFIVPNTALTGTTRARIILSAKLGQNTIEDPTPCGSLNYGSVYDFDVEITKCAISFPQIDGKLDLCIGDKTTLLVKNNYSTYLWNTGEKSPSIQVDKPGKFTVTVTSADGCTAINEVITTINTPPSIVLQTNSNCSADNVLFAKVTNGKSPYFYNWSNNDKTASINKLNTGNYSLTVTDANNCVSTQSISFTKTLLENAQVDNSKTCGTQFNLKSNLPTGSTGIWKILNGNGKIVDKSLSNTTIFDLKTVKTILSWTLSTLLCPSYSSDTMTIDADSRKIIAEDDRFKITLAKLTDTVDIFKNDKFNGVVDFDFKQLSKPLAGELIYLGNGLYKYIFDAQNPGNAYFSYQICNKSCPDSCAIGKVAIVINQGNDEESGKQPPAIFTPNGDGLNDNWVVDNIEAHPKNELFIYSRWGSLVWKGKMTTEGWNGTNQNGGKLPDGTYYYVLQLDTANGKTIFGDILVVSN